MTWRDDAIKQAEQIIERALSEDHHARLAIAERLCAADELKAVRAILFLGDEPIPAEVMQLFQEMHGGPVESVDEIRARIGDSRENRVPRAAAAAVDAAARTLRGHRDEIAQAVSDLFVGEPRDLGYDVADAVLTLLGKQEASETSESSGPAESTTFLVDSRQAVANPPGGARMEESPTTITLPPDWRREGMVVVADADGRLVGCMGVDVWRGVLGEQEASGDE